MQSVRRPCACQRRPRRQGARGADTRVPTLNCGREIEAEIARIEPLLAAGSAVNGKYESRWLVLKLLENDKELRSRISSPETAGQLEKGAARVETEKPAVMATAAGEEEKGERLTALDHAEAEATLLETIQVLEESRKAFKSRQRESLRKRWIEVLAETA